MMDAKRHDHLALFSPLALKEFCLKFSSDLGLPEMHFDFENENEWALVEFMDVEYNISRPFEMGLLQQWDSSVPRGCNFSITVSPSIKQHPTAGSDSANTDFTDAIAQRLANIYKTQVYYHRTWVGIGKNEIKDKVFEPTR